MRVKEFDIIGMENTVAEWVAQTLKEPNTTYDVNEIDVPGLDAYVMWIFERDMNGKPSLSYNIVFESCDVYSAPQELAYSLDCLDEPEAFHQFEADYYSWADTLEE